MIEVGPVGRAVFTFLIEIIGPTRGQVEALRDAPGGRDVLPVGNRDRAGGRRPPGSRPQPGPGHDGGDRVPAD
jgi:hypothetical protein